MKGIRRKIAYFVLVIVLICIVTAAFSAIKNQNLPTGPFVLDKLSTLDKARLAETLHLKNELGELVWPGWNQQDFPIILSNQDYSFLIGYQDPPSEWILIDGDSFYGEPYYWKRANDVQNFAVPIGENWAASMATKWETDRFIMSIFRDLIPWPLKIIFPYWLLIQPSEVQISAVLHETFHVYQVLNSPQRLKEAEEAHKWGDEYWLVDGVMQEDWIDEIDLLYRALQSQTDTEVEVYISQFLELRDKRRLDAQLNEALVEYERQLEWEEGLAKYVELAIWRAASNSPNYRPITEMVNDPEFKGYDTFQQRWSQEVSQMKRQASQEGETRFYYTGMAQAMLLDDLLPGWKTIVLEDGIWLETLLADAINVGK